MSGRFVSGGTISSSGEVSKEAPAGNDGSGSGRNAAKSPQDAAKLREWEAVQQELEAERRRREEQRVKAASGEGEKSLYDILQANKAAKEAAFEEQTKIRNQFRALNDDEVDFLDEVATRKRAEEDRARREIEQGLKAFREQQQRETPSAAAAAASGGVDETEVEHWEAGRKRKRGVREKEIKGLRRRVSGEAGKGGGKDGGKKAEGDAEESKAAETSKAAEAGSEKAPEKKTLGLVAYGSDSDDE